MNSRDLFAGKSLRAPATIDDEGLAGALALPGRPLRPPRPRRCRPHARGPPRRPHPRLDLGGVDAPYARSRCPRLAPLWRPAAHRRHHPGSGTSCAPSSPTSTWRRAPTSPAPPLARPHRRHPVTRGRPLTGAARSPAAPRRQGPPSAPLPPPVTTAGFRAHHPRKESAPNGAVSAPSRVLRPVHHGIPRPPCRPPPAPRGGAVGRPLLAGMVRSEPGGGQGRREWGRPRPWRLGAAGDRAAPVRRGGGQRDP